MLGDYLSGRVCWSWFVSFRRAPVAWFASRRLVRPFLGFGALAVMGLTLSVSLGMAADRSPEVDAAVQKGMSFLRSQPSLDHEAGLTIYALIAAGEPPNSPAVKKLVDQLLKKFTPEGGYVAGGHHVYAAGIDAMGLTAANRELYQPQIQLVADYIMKDQRANGSFDYSGAQFGGDTSISQYGMLGLWAASRAGIKIPLKVWDQTAIWHMKTHLKEGAFGYHPLGGEAHPSHSMTVAGVGSLCIARIFLTDPSQSGVDLSETPDETAKPKKKDTKAFGVLEKLTPTETAPTDAAPKVDPVDNYKPVVSRRELDGHIGGGMAWLSKHYTIDKPTGWPIYYLYGLERAGALTSVEKLGGRDWYKEGSDHLVKTQKPDGSWYDQSGAIASTSFGLLFLTRATEKIAPVAPVAQAKKGAPTLAGGMLQGGRGLPTDLANVDTKGGQIKAKVLDTPLDRLLADLENPKSQNVEATQAALVESVQLGSRETLIGQKDLLLKLAIDSRSEVRRTAFWALGRCNDLRVVPLLLKGLLDADFDASVEARTALCMLSRRPRGFGLLDDVLEKLPETATPDERDAVVEKWRREDATRWKDWYQRVRPYDERDNLPD